MRDSMKENVVGWILFNAVVVSLAGCACLIFAQARSYGVFALVWSLLTGVAAAVCESLL